MSEKHKVLDTLLLLASNVCFIEIAASTIEYANNHLTQSVNPGTGGGLRTPGTGGGDFNQVGLKNSTAYSEFSCAFGSS